MARTRVVLSSVLSLVLLLALAACSSSPTSSPPTGILTVVVSGLPSGVSGTVLVTGPGGYSKNLTSTRTLIVPPGTYTISGSAVWGTNAIVPVVYGASTSSPSVDVAAGATAYSTVTYGGRPGSGHLWVPMDSTLEAESYASADLASSGSPGPDVTLSSSSHYGEAVAFDGAGNLWVADYNGYVFEYAAADLDTSGTPTPVVKIDLTAYGSALYALAFDAAGDLWVPAYDANKLLMLTPSQLAAGGVQSATVEISATSGGSLVSPEALAFDASGALWVANYTNIAKFTPAQLAASGSPHPSVVLSVPSGTTSYPVGIAFDASGNLWVSNQNSTIVRFDAGQLGTGGSPTPAATLQSPSTIDPSGLAFDASGNLWVSEPSSATLRAFKNPGALTGSVAPGADVTVSSIGSVSAALLAFDPPPADLPINAP